MYIVEFRRLRSLDNALRPANIVFDLLTISLPSVPPVGSLMNVKGNPYFVVETNYAVGQDLDGVPESYAYVLLVKAGDYQDGYERSSRA